MKLKELYAKKRDLLAKCDELQEDPKATVEQINAAADELKAINAKIQLAEDLKKDEKDGAENKVNNGEMKQYAEEDNEEPRNSEEYAEAFYNAVRGRNLTVEDRNILESVSNALSSETGEDGGYLIPADQETAIIELKRQMKSLESEVNVEVVTTKSGSRNVEKDAEHTPFTEFTEGNDVPASDSPQFVLVNYAIADRGGILPVPNNLLRDNTANLKGYLNKWLAKKQVATRNHLIATELATLTPTAIASFDDVKDTFNVSLDPSLSDIAKVYTNQDGFNWLDKQKDTDGNYWLQPHPTDKTKKLLNGREVKVYSNKTLKTTGTTTLLAPIYFGVMKECITLFDRQAMSLLSTNVGGDSFKKNRTDIRAITREDVEMVDSAAMIFGQLDVTPA